MPAEVLHLGPCPKESDVLVRPPARIERAPAGADGTVHLHRTRRIADPWIPYLPGRRRAGSAGPRVGRARRSVDARRLGTRSRGAVAGEPGLCVCPRELSWLQRL